jgi:hypothetical protein
MPDVNYVRELMNIPGNVRGVVFITDREYIRRYHSDAVLENIVRAMQETGHPIAYDDIKSMEWYPLGLRALSFKIMRDVLKWSDDEFRIMGNNAPKFSFIVKLLMKWFTSPRTAFNHSPEYWQRHYDVGSLEIDEFNEPECYAVFRILDFATIPLWCVYLEGYFKRLFQFTFPGKHITMKETKCMNRGDPYHEFRGEWRD